MKTITFNCILCPGKIVFDNEDELIENSCICEYNPLRENGLFVYDPWPPCTPAAEDVCGPKHSYFGDERNEGRCYCGKVKYPKGGA